MATSLIDNAAAFDALADGQRRRLLVRLLDGRPYHVPPLSSVSREMTSADNALLRQYLSGSLHIAGADKALVRLHHVHLPELAEYGFVEWERDTNVVTQGPRFDEVRPLLELMDDNREDEPATDVVVPLSG